MCLGDLYEAKGCVFLITSAKGCGFITWMRPARSIRPLRAPLRGVRISFSYTPITPFIPASATGATPRDGQHSTLYLTLNSHVVRHATMSANEDGRCARKKVT